MSNDEIYNIWSNFSRDYLKNYDLIWQSNLKDVKKYIDEYKKRPTDNNESHVKHLANWLSSQITRYNQRHVKKYTKQPEWESFITSDKYKIYFEKTEYDNSGWFNNLKDVKKYIDIYGKRPSDRSNDPIISSLRKWISKQITSYREHINLMKYPEIYNAWHNFVNDVKYKTYFLDKDIIWFNTLQKVKNYIDEHQKKPSYNKKDSYELHHLNYWVIEQQKHYKTKTSQMLNTAIYEKWCNFINDDKYKIYFT
jgi:hypothetical protein